ncbi:adenine phosphoribosyltransferase [Candidatus Shapirobacteria bacterium CG08_land_8_20_14_0_20_39_18]|uniref:Adenine phosphoribosyltransferase n=1 Tax=Candidatus Shapirobacteria bacterium CG08_land_8_20_14_0_20_39_18 TaxID=1974883 RepID=A0A2M6XBV7_9BACT|nr:MAG: adenine phosphoribosyltransferase [Candidatus Shapirobacteria bacterium CG08_land_8_20_14_0_20_39_18]PJE68467.1 MAG: adenine phosphoribosyltransferase [Candidatus Shapirobacteria bacterium CG10_big_fil_rev_8_21_14_0_10_38_8]
MFPKLQTQARPTNLPPKPRISLIAHIKFNKKRQFCYHNFMNVYKLNICGLERELPIVSIGPLLKIASFNLLGDGELVKKVAESLAEKIKDLDFDYLVGPEVKVVPLMQELSNLLKKPRYIILRKNIMGYMTHPISSKTKPGMVLNGPDAELIKGKKVLIVDDVVSTGKTIKVVDDLMKEVNARVVGVAAVLKQGEEKVEITISFYSLGKLPLFGT